MTDRADIDIDVYDRDKALSIVKHHLAMMDKNGEKVKHNTGVYFQDIPFDPFTNISTIEYKEADELGYFKIDILNVHLYKDVKDEEHLLRLINTEPKWELFEDEEVVKQLFHIGNYFSVCKKFKPRSIEDLAIILALIRPSKKHLQECDKETILKEIWKKPEDGSYYFKKSHSIAYAVAIVVQLNLLCGV